jgi:hypothetical protein
VQLRKHLAGKNWQLLGMAPREECREGGAGALRLLPWMCAGPRCVLPQKSSTLRDGQMMVGRAQPGRDVNG